MNVQIIDLLNPLWQETLQKLRHDTYHLPEYFWQKQKELRQLLKLF